MSTRALQWVLLGMAALSLPPIGVNAVFGGAPAKDAGKKDPAPQLFQLMACEARESLYVSNGSGGMTVKQHNVAIDAKDLETGQVQHLTLAEAKDGPLSKVLEGMKVGDLVMMTTQKQFNHTYVKTLVPYKLRPGEDRPNVFIFESSGTQKTSAGDATTVTLTKLGRTGTVAVANVKDKTGKSAPDEHIVQTLGTLKPGDSVEVVVEGGGVMPTLKSLEPYAVPQSAVFGKLTEAEVEGGKTLAIEVAIGGSARTVLIPGKLDAQGKWAADVNLVAVVKGFTAGDKVVVRIRSADGKDWLKEIARDTAAPAKA